jgi:hypothetical protein
MLSFIVIARMRLAIKQGSRWNNMTRRYPLDTVDMIRLPWKCQSIYRHHQSVKLVIICWVWGTKIIGKSYNSLLYTVQGSIFFCHVCMCSLSLLSHHCDPVISTLDVSPKHCRRPGEVPFFASKCPFLKKGTIPFWNSSRSLVNWIESPGLRRFSYSFRMISKGFWGA